MQRPDGNQLDTAALRELNALDAALAGEPVDPALAQVAELAVALRDVRPRPRPQFQMRLDDAARNGFQRSATSSAAAPLARGAGWLWRLGSPGGLARRWRATPLLAGTAACALLVAVAVLSSGGGKSAKPEATRVRTTTAKPQAAPAAGAPAKAGGARRNVPSEGRVQSDALPPFTPSTAPHLRHRAVERAASLTLAPAPEEVEAVADRVIAVTDRYQGFVLRSTVSAGAVGTAGGHLELRIPASRLQPALRDLSALAHVRSRTQNSEDVTGVMLSRRARLAEKLAERRGLLRQLARAPTPNESASIRLRLRLVNREIAQARASLAALRNKVSYAAVAVELQADDNAVQPGKHGSGTLGGALSDAREVLETSVAVALVSLAVLFPLSMLGLLGVAAARLFARQRRERALDDLA